MSKLEKASHISVIAVCIVAAWTLLGGGTLRDYFRKGSRGPGPQVGGRMNLEGVKWDDAKLNVVIAVQSHCPYCAASIGLYRRLTEVSKSAGPGVSLIACSYERSNVTNDFLKSGGAEATKTVQVPFRDVGISGTPTIVLVDGTGQIKKVYEGKLKPAQEAELLSILRS